MRIRSEESPRDSIDSFSSVEELGAANGWERYHAKCVVTLTGSSQGVAKMGREVEIERRIEVGAGHHRYHVVEGWPQLPEVATRSKGGR